MSEINSMAESVTHNLSELTISEEESNSVDIPITPDSKFLKELNSTCMKLTSDLEDVVEKVAKTLHSISALTVGNVQTCTAGVQDVGEAIDKSVHSMYSLIASSEELDKEMMPVLEIAEKVKRVKTVLTALEENLP